MKRAVLLLAFVVAGCGGGPVLANPPAQRPVATTAPKPPASLVADPVPVVFPRDDAPHRRLTEWWYYTGHLVDSAGGHWGFEFVVFRAERGSFPVSWASHLALTDEGGKRFLYAQRAEIGPQVDASGATGFDFSVLGANKSAWTMAGSGGDDRLRAAAATTEVSGSGAGTPFAIDLSLKSRKPPALHAFRAPKAAVRIGIKRIEIWRNSYCCRVIDRDLVCCDERWAGA